MATQLLLATSLFIHITTSCNYYAERHPEPPFDEVARYPLGVCTGNHYSHNKIAQESVMYLCGSDSSHIIKYSYTESSKCDGEYVASIATRNPNDFRCEDKQTCPYVVVKVQNQNQNQNDWRKWYSSAWVTNHCQKGELYTCEDNKAYKLNKFSSNNCDDLPKQVLKYSSGSKPSEIFPLIVSDAPDSNPDEMIGLPDADQNILTPYTNSILNYDIFCNEPDPMTVVINYPDNTMFINTKNIAWAGDGSVTEEIETAVCLDGRIAGQNREIGDESVSYCFLGYDEENSRPIYRGEFGEIRWTESAGTLGGAYGLFLHEPTDPLGKKYPFAYCFSGESKDISVCDKQWYIDHGTSSRYYLDENLEMSECECTVDLEQVAAQFNFHPPSIPSGPSETTTTEPSEGTTTTEGGSDHGHGAFKGATTTKGTETSDSNWYHVRVGVFLAVINCVLW